MKAERVVPDGVYVDRSLNHWRRVIAVDDFGERYVVYSVGTDTNRICLLRTFCRWAEKRISVDADGMIEEVDDEGH